MGLLLIMMDYLVSELSTEECDRLSDYHGQVAIPDAMLCINRQKELTEMYGHRACDVSYIFYTGVGCKRSKQHSIKEFLHIGSAWLREEGNMMASYMSWPVLVVLMGAGVKWL